MPTNIKQFLSEMRAGDRRIMLLEVQFLKTVAFEAFRRFVAATPKDTGRATGGWTVSIGTPSRGPADNKDKSGTRTIASGLSTIQKLARLQDVYITNNVPYILVLDEGGFRPRNPGPSEDPRPDRRGRVLVRRGFSVQAPNGITGPVLEDLRRWVAQ